MKVLYLTLKAKFYDMIESGEKLEEYRELKSFWINRLVLKNYRKYSAQLDANAIKQEYNGKHLFHSICNEFDAVCFARGGHFHPSIPQMTLECKGIEIGEGRPAWGAEKGKEYFVIKLGEILKSDTLIK